MLFKSIVDYIDREVIVKTRKNAVDDYSIWNKFLFAKHKPSIIVEYFPIPNPQSQPFDVRSSGFTWLMTAKLNWQNCDRLYFG